MALNGHVNPERKLPKLTKVTLKLILFSKWIQCNFHDLLYFYAYVHNNYYCFIPLSYTYHCFQIPLMLCTGLLVCEWASLWNSSPFICVLAGLRMSLEYLTSRLVMSPESPGWFRNIGASFHEMSTTHNYILYSNFFKWAFHFITTSKENNHLVRT